MRTGVKFTLLLASALLLFNPSFATVERGTTWDRYCGEDGVCFQTFYGGAVNTIDESGQYVPFESVTEYYWSPEAEGWNFTGSFRNFSAWFVLKPYVQHSNGNWYDYSDIKDAFPSADFKNHVQGLRGTHKFSLNITDIPQALADNIERIAFVVEQAYNLGWDDVRLESPCVIIKEKVRFCYQDILDSDLTVNLYNRSVVLIGNVTGKTDIILDPTIWLNDADSEVLDDTFTESEDTDAVNGADDDIRVGNWTVAGHYTVDSFIRFNNMSDIPTKQQVTDGTLALYILYNYYSVSGTVYVYELDNYTWSEETMAYTNRTTDWGDLLDSVTTGSEGLWVTFNVTTWVDEVYEAGHQNVSFFLNGTKTGLNPMILFNSKEYATPAQRPYLNITYEPDAPEIVDNYTTPAISYQIYMNATAEVYDGNDNILWVNFTVTDPFGTVLINNENGTTFGTNLWNSSDFYVGSYGNYTVNITIGDSDSKTDTIEWKILLTEEGGGGGSSTNGGGFIPGVDCGVGDLEVYPKVSLSFTYPSVSPFQIKNWKGEAITFTAELSDNLADYCILENDQLEIVGSGSSENLQVACTVMPESDYLLGNITFKGGGCEAVREICVGAGCGLWLSQVFSFFALFINMGMGLLTQNFNAVWSSFSEFLGRTLRPDLGSVIAWLMIYGVLAALYLAWERQKHPSRSKDTERMERFGYGAVFLLLFLGVLALSSWLAVDVLRII